MTPLQSRVFRFIVARPDGATDRELFETFRPLAPGTVLNAVRWLVAAGKVETAAAFTVFRAVGGGR